MAEKTVRKTTAKKSPRKAVSKTASVSAAPKRTSAATMRKAPSRISPSQSRQSAKGVIVIGILFFLLLGISAAIGFSDKGQLDVPKTIAERKQSATPEEKKVLDSVPVQQPQNNTPNGGLVGAGKSAPQPIVSPASVEASSSEATTTPALQHEATTASQSSDTVRAQ